MLKRLLGDATEAFLRETYLRAPAVFRGTAGALREAVGPPVVDALLPNPEINLLLVRSGAPYPGARPQDRVAAAARLAEGYTLAFRDPHRHAEGIRDLARGMSADLHAWANVHIYWTPPGQQGFSWHYDPEEVFIVQIDGTKEYLGKPNASHPNPTEEAMFPVERGAKVEHTAEQRWELAPGDVLYLPGGYWHCARAVTESVSLSFGMMPPVTTDLLEYLRRSLLRSPEWRTRLAPLGRASPLGDLEQMELMRRHLSELGEVLRAELANPEFALRFLADTARAFVSQEPISHVRPSGRVPQRNRQR